MTERTASARQEEAPDEDSLGKTEEDALSHLRVLELADAQGWYCGKLLADLGADVVRIDETDPRALPTLDYLYMNTNKRSVALDLESAEDQPRLQQLIERSDLLIETLDPAVIDRLGLDFESLHARHPQLVVTSISGFGRGGPRANYRSSDLVASALGGAMHVTGEREDPPVRLAGNQAYLSASVVAAAASLTALRHRDGGGGAQHVDVSIEEAVVSMSHISGVGKWLDDGIVPLRNGSSLFASVPSGAYRCSDGLVYLMVNRPAHWKALAEWICEATGIEEVLDPLFEGPSSRRIPYRDLIDVYIDKLISSLRVAAAVGEGQRRHIAITPISTAGDVVASPHLAARGFFVRTADPDLGSIVMPGAPYRPSRTPWRIRRPAPRPGEHTRELLQELQRKEDQPRSLEVSIGERRAARGDALAGLRIVEFTAGMAGPWIGRFMAWAGAEVIRVESHSRPDVLRLYVPPRASNGAAQPTMSPWLTDWNAGKRFVALDLTKAGAVAIAKRLVAASDVVIENYSSGVMDKLGLGYDELARVKPDLVMLSTTGYGASGPQCRYVTWGPNIEAASGLAALSGFAERECTITQYAYPDAASAVHGLVAVLAALAYRDRSGEGQWIELAQLETMAAMLGPLLMERMISGREPARLGNRDLSAAPQACYPCRGRDRWCAVTIFGARDWAALCRVIGRSQWADDPGFATIAARRERTQEIDHAIEAWTRRREAEAVMEELQAAEIAAGVVQTVEDQYRRDPQLAARGFFESIEHRTRGRVTAVGVPLGLTGTPGSSRHSGSAVGEDNDYVLGELLGMTREEIAAALAEGAVEPARS